MVLLELYLKIKAKKTDVFFKFLISSFLLSQKCLLKGTFEEGKLIDIFLNNKTFVRMTGTHLERELVSCVTTEFMDDVLYVLQNCRYYPVSHFMLCITFQRCQPKYFLVRLNKKAWSTLQILPMC